MRIREIVIASGAGLVLALAGCGTRALSKHDYVSKANMVCRAGNAKLQSVAHPTSRVAFARYVDRVKPIVRESGSRLHALAPPKADRGFIDRMLNLYDQEPGKLDLLKAAVDRKDVAGARQLIADFQAKATAFNTMAASYGLIDCARGPTG